MRKGIKHKYIKIYLYFMNIKQKLVISQLIRIMSTIIVLFFFKIPLYLKIILILYFDYFDCPRILIDYFNIKWISCRDIHYQKSDKITDTICYLILLLYNIQKKALSDINIQFITLLFIYRLFGVILFLIKNNRKYLFYFPNFFLEITLVLSLFNRFSLFKITTQYLIIILIMVLKIFQEYLFHFTIRKNHR